MSSLYLAWLELLVLPVQYKWPESIIVCAVLLYSVRQYGSIRQYCHERYLLNMEALGGTIWRVDFEL